ncbi:hypothetical protein [Pelagicoccus sp. SDUM812003]|uniref:hypothetical protein n=1 Tax=Pelagicoccus sp. SDUM812003 TaxID=3041267 RepID=UPI00280FB52F|nr:hypothetical protein [Pelagicoccus sp. SDUM812003]MDQ8203880.1 hypothetical protein [Pelagicoccus sp. SDUM812003]
MFRILKKRLFAAAIALLAVYAFAQMKPGTPVNNFKVPLFNEDGYRTWYLRGETGVYVSETQIRIENMRVSQYSGDEQDRRIAVLTSPEAIFHFDSTTAYGPGELRIATDAFEVSGTDWIWKGQNREITLNQNVKVSLYEGIGDILK